MSGGYVQQYAQRSEDSHGFNEAAAHERRIRQRRDARAFKVQGFNEAAAHERRILPEGLHVGGSLDLASMRPPPMSGGYGALAKEAAPRALVRVCENLRR